MQLVVEDHPETRLGNRYVGVKLLPDRRQRVLFPDPPAIDDVAGHAAIHIHLSVDLTVGEGSWNAGGGEHDLVHAAEIARLDSALGLGNEIKNARAGVVQASR